MRTISAAQASVASASASALASTFFPEPSASSSSAVNGRTASPSTTSGGLAPSAAWTGWKTMPSVKMKASGRRLNKRLTAATMAAVAR